MSGLVWSMFAAFVGCVLVLAFKMGGFCRLTGHDWVRLYSDESTRECDRCGVRG